MQIVQRLFVQFLTYEKIANIYTVKVEDDKFKLRTEICLWGLSLFWVLLQTRLAHSLSPAAAFGTRPYAKYNRASAFFSVHNHGFCDGLNTFFLCLSQLSNFRNSRNIAPCCLLSATNHMMYSLRDNRHFVIPKCKNQPFQGHFYYELTHKQQH